LRFDEGDHIEARDKPEHALQLRAWDPWTKQNDAMGGRPIV
jgi:hypothetical protein